MKISFHQNYVEGHEKNISARKLKTALQSFVEIMDHKIVMGREALKTLNGYGYDYMYEPDTAPFGASMRDC